MLAGGPGEGFFYTFSDPLKNSLVKVVFLKVSTWRHDKIVTVKYSCILSYSMHFRKLQSIVGI
jgi:hypothetical protein